jgi:bacterioferritin (cytochrome b1)
MLTNNELWLLSFYRTSEISGSLFFGRLARSMKPGRTQHDMTKHFADEAAHAWQWTNCIETLGESPLKLTHAYQDNYLEAAGIPANLMEVLAVTQVFEQRVIGQYAMHAKVPELEPTIKDTLKIIMADERWHIEWIKRALAEMEKEYGPAEIEAALARFRQADRLVYEQASLEHEDQLATLLGATDIARGNDHVFRTNQRPNRPALAPACSPCH